MILTSLRVKCLQEQCDWIGCIQDFDASSFTYSQLSFSYLYNLIDTNVDLLMFILAKL